MVKAGVTNPYVLLGVFFEALFFVCLLILMAESDISFLWPLTGLSFVMRRLPRCCSCTSGFLHPVGGRRVHHDRRRADQLQRARQAEANSACGDAGAGRLLTVASDYAGKLEIQL